MTRERLSLNGRWSFWPDGHDRTASAGFLDPSVLTTSLGPPRPINVPGSWQAQFSDLRTWAGVAWYATTFRVPDAWRGRRLRISIGACDYFTEGWVDGNPVGEHEGGYLPFSFEIEPALGSGPEHELVLRVVDRGGDWLDYLDVAAGQPESSLFPLPTIRSHEPPGQRFPLAEIPHGKQSWYGPIGGLWQDVFLEMRPTDAIEHVLVTPAMDGDVSAHVELAYPLAEPGRLEATITSPDRRTTWRVAPEAVPAGAVTHELLASVGAPTVWDLDEPNLYEIAVTLRTERSDDTWTDTFGFRSIETRDGHVVLNGRPVYLLGALDQNYYHPDDPAPSTSETFRQDVVAAKAMGLNLLRCHIKVPDPRYLRAADELGILVWEEIPNWLFLTDASRRRARETFAGMVRRDHNRPSVVIRSVINEGWGADLVREPDHRAWLSETTRWAHELDPTRLLVDNSACAPTFHLRSSLNDFHRYWALPDEHATMVRWLDDWIAAPASTFDANGTSERSGTEPLVLSEFGAWGLPDVANLLDPEGGEPWWFTTGEGWMHGAVVAEGIEDRFKAWGLDRAFGTWERFGRESREHQFESLRAQVEELRRRPQMAGYVVTQFTDVHWEVNGLLDGSRTPKMSPERLRAVNAPTLVLARPAALRARAGARMPVEVSVSHFSNADLDGCSVAWEADGRAGRLDGSVARATVTAVGSMDLEVAGTGPHTAWFSLLDRHGRLVHRTDATVWGFDDVTLATDEVIVADRWTHELAGRVAAGERCIVVASEPAALPSGSRLEVRARARTMWQGHWAQGMGWLDPSLTSGLGVGPRVGTAFTGVTPAHVIKGFEPNDHADVLGGYYVGWLRAHVATIGAFRHGDGAGVVCTFPLLERQDDPLAASLLARLRSLVADAAFDPAVPLFGSPT
jgi:hypothetical protein